MQNSSTTLLPQKKQEWLNRLSMFPVSAHSALRGLDWFMGGVEILKKAPAWMMLCGLGVVLGTVLLSLIPGVGSLAAQMIAPVFVVGLARFCSQIEKSQKEALNSSLFKELFVGFQGPVEKLLIIGAVQLLGSLAIAILTFLPALILIFISASDLSFSHLQNVEDQLAALLTSGKFWILILSFVAFLFLYIPLSLATWFAPQLIHFHKMEPAEALKASLKGCLTNASAMGVYGGVWLLVGGMATLPLGLGWVVCLPILIGSGWVCYREIFGDLS